MWFEAISPGSLMLLGEYAVLSGFPAIVGAVDQFIQVTLKPRSDNQIMIHSVLGKYETNINHIEMISPFEYVLTAIALQVNQNKLSHKFQSGFELSINGNCQSGIGLGSSAAVTVATLAVINHWLTKTACDKKNLWEQGMQVIHQVAGQGSGADLAASIYGGVIAFQKKPLQIEPLASTLPLCAVYSGEKLKTSEAIDRVNQHRNQHTDFFAAIDKAIAQLSLAAIPAIKNQNWKSLGLLFNWAHELLNILGVSNPLLNALVTTLRNQNTPGKIWGAKISGSGFGDCVIGLGELKPNVFPRQIPLAITPIGVRMQHE